MSQETIEHKTEADRLQKAEYWRKLYVAMTRAEDELYVTGYLTKARDGAGSWYEAIERALAPMSEVIADAEGAPLAMIYPRERPSRSAGRSHGPQPCKHRARSTSYRSPPIASAASSAPHRPPMMCSRRPLSPPMPRTPPHAIPRPRGRKASRSTRCSTIC